MYISIERNSRGSLEIDEKLLSKIIEFDVRSNAKGFKDIQASVSIHQETSLFIVVRIYTMEKGLFLMDGVKVTSIINDSIHKTLGIKPKNIAFAFIK
ncbi:MMB_0454 family protein [Spiroplasma floricola]|uniref:Uncharacterized protein n=1 Tax=Spiroplasma floricola 23-6 TaxID=1336749 RepID=A0A2K8SDA6_9MOLU|nr:hypothetical protein [Spiroplasma floricola]AUB31436.1 hypothetical protein SFLOR_v1c03790 [Spiroplasma floricola 23-6]